MEIKTKFNVGDHAYFMGEACLVEEVIIVGVYIYNMNDDWHKDPVFVYDIYKLKDNSHHTHFSDLYNTFFSTFAEAALESKKELEKRKSQDVAQLKNKILHIQEEYEMQIKKYQIKGIKND